MKEKVKVLLDFDVAKEQIQKGDDRYFIVNLHSKSAPFLTELGWIDREFNEDKLLNDLKTNHGIMDAKIILATEYTKEKYNELKHR